MHDFHEICTPNTWSGIAGQYPKRYPSNIFNAYVLLASVIDLRRASNDCPVNSFLDMQEDVKVALKDISSLEIRTPEIASTLKSRCQLEEALLTGGEVHCLYWYNYAVPDTTQRYHISSFLFSSGFAPEHVDASKLGPVTMELAN
jgi:hypothetical protein